MKLLQDRDITKDNITWAGLTYHSGKGLYSFIQRKLSCIQIKLIHLLFTLCVLCAYLLIKIMCSTAPSLSEDRQISKIQQEHEQKIQAQKQEQENLSLKYSNFFVEIVDLKSMIQSEIQHQGNNKFIYDPQNFMSIESRNGVWKYFYVDYIDARDNLEHVGRDSDVPVNSKNEKLISILDADNNRVNILPEKEKGFYIQLAHKTPEECKNIIHPIADLEKVTVNTIQTNINDPKDIAAKCSINGLNNIQYYFYGNE